MINDYSQHGEGKIIAEYFGENFPGTLVSIGENDGKILSNVLGLIEDGWKAHLVEPCDIPFGKLKKRHGSNPKVKLYHYAIADTNGYISILESGEHLGQGDTSLLSTIDENEVKRWKGICTFTRKKVRCKTTQSFVDDVNESAVDLVSIDCEGLDFYILKQLPLQQWLPRMVVVETNSIGNTEVIHYMSGEGYKLHYNNFCNLIFVRK